MARVNEKECEAAGLNPLDVKRIAQGLSRYAKEAQKLGIQVFGGSGCGDLRFDGGDGACSESDDGLMRGEF